MSELMFKVIEHIYLGHLKYEFPTPIVNSKGIKFKPDMLTYF